MTAPDLDRLIERLDTFVRDNLQGQCKILSRGDDCPCALCALDNVRAALKEGPLHTRVPPISTAPDYSD